MRILFLGDICSEKACRFVDQKYFSIAADANKIIANLEGAVSSIPRSDIVCNSLKIFEVIESLKISAVSLANNHIFDDENLFDGTIDLLKSKQIPYFGAGQNISEAQTPFIVEDSDQKICFFSFGWDVIGCKPASLVSQGVNPFCLENLFETVRQFRKADKDAGLVFLFHWNYELEIYPQPMYRQMAKDLIDAGVDAIVGGHPHIAQGAELYKNKPIVYSLGNWFFPPRKLGNLNLRYPEIANLQLALELSFSCRDNIGVKFHWFLFRPDECEIVYKNTECFDGEILKALTPFENMTHESYCNWFKINRRKSFFLPIYRDHKKIYVNYLKDLWVHLRKK